MQTAFCMTPTSGPVVLYGHVQVMAESTSLEVCLSTGVLYQTWCVSGSWRCHGTACVRVTSPGSFASRMAASARYSAGQYSLTRSIIITCIAFVYTCALHGYQFGHYQGRNYSGVFWVLKHPSKIKFKKIYNHLHSPG